MTPFVAKPVYRTGDLAKLFGVSGKTALRLLEAGHLPSYQLPAPILAHRRVLHDDLIAWLRRMPELRAILDRLEYAVAVAERAGPQETPRKIRLARGATCVAR